MRKKFKTVGIVSVVAAASVVGTQVSTAYAAPARSSVSGQPSHARVTGSHQDLVAQAALGQHLFDALYFGTGPLVKGIQHQLNDPNYDAFLRAVRTKPQQERLAAAVNRAVKRADRRVFNKFAVGVTSGNPFQVKAALKSMSSSVQSLKGTDAGSVDGRSQGDCIAFTVAAAGAAVYLSAAVVQFAAIVAQGAVFAEALFWGAVPAGGSDGRPVLSSDAGIAGLTKAMQGMTPSAR